MGKKAKKADARGYATTSIATAPRPVPVKAEAPPPIKQSTVVTVTEVSSDELSEHARNVLHEADYLRKVTLRSQYRGKLFPPTKIEYQHTFSFPSKEVLDAVLKYAKSTVVVPPDEFRMGFYCQLNSFSRCSRNLHALLGAGIGDKPACDAVAEPSMRGFDERAMLAWLVEECPAQLPAGWRDFEHLLPVPPTELDELSSDMESGLGLADATTATTATTAAPVGPVAVALTAAERAEKLRMNQQAEAPRFEAIRRASALVERLKNETDLPPPTMATAVSPAKGKGGGGANGKGKGKVVLEQTPTERYFELKDHASELRQAVGHIERKKDKDLIKARLKAVTAELGALEPLVEWPGANKSKEMDQTQTQSEADATDAAAAPAADVEAAAAQEVVVAKQEQQEQQEEEEEDCGGMCGLFGELEEDCEGPTGTNGGETASAPGPAPVPVPAPRAPVFLYTHTKGEVTPVKLLSDLVTDTRRFEYLRQGANQWKERVEIGPLSSASAKQLGLARGVLITASPPDITDITIATSDDSGTGTAAVDAPLSTRVASLSVDQESARQLCCLRLLFELTPAATRSTVARRLNKVAAKQWDGWLEFETSVRAAELAQKAEMFADAIEAYMQPPLSTAARSFGESNCDDGGGGGGVVAKNDTGKRLKGTTVAALRVEMASRRGRGQLKLEGIRAELPATLHCGRIIDIIQSHEISIICGETGSGKSTQVPQLLVREAAEAVDGLPGMSSTDRVNIIVTEPRRVATVSVSSRVSEELGDIAIGSSQALCGYTVRLDSKVGPRCCIEYVTVGVLLRRIQATRGGCLGQYSHVVVDEVHERSVDSDLLLLLLREYKDKARGQSGSTTAAVTTASDMVFPRIVLMSATADEAAITSYWTGASADPADVMAAASGGPVTPSVATTHIPGRTFPVNVTYLEDVIEASGYGRAGVGTDGDGAGVIDLGEDAERQCMIAANASGIGYSGVGSSSDYKEYPESFINQLDTTIYCPRTCDVLFRMLPTLQQKIDYDLLTHVIRYQLQHSATNGAIIVFLAGLEDIKRVINAVQCDRELSSLCVPIAMHSSLSFDELQQAFRPLPSSGAKPKRKLIVSTNICETGVTIEDVDLVIDTGFVKSMEWNEVTEFSRLRTHRCSVAESMQRRGRAGRVRTGACVHLFPRCMMEGGTSLGSDLKRLKLRPEPEMARAPLTTPILSLVDQEFPPQLLLRAPGSTVARAKLDNAVAALVELDALVVYSDIEREAMEPTPTVADAVVSYRATALGRTLAALPCDPRSGKILLAARELGCLHAAAVFIASLDCKNIFLSSEQSGAFFKKQFVKGSGSDVVAVVNAYSEWTRADKKFQWSRANGISMSAMQQVAAVAQDLMKSLDTLPSAGVGPLPGEVCVACRSQYGLHCCVTGGNKDCLHAAICVGMGKRVAYRARQAPVSGKESRLFFHCSDKVTKCVSIHRASLVSEPTTDWIVYCAKMVGMHDSQTLSSIGSVSLATVLLFSTWVKFFIADGTIIVGNGIGVKCTPQTLVALHKLRRRWNDVLINGSNNAEEPKILVKLLAELIVTS